MARLHHLQRLDAALRAVVRVDRIGAGGRPARRCSIVVIVGSFVRPRAWRWWTLSAFESPRSAACLHAMSYLLRDPRAARAAAHASEAEGRAVYGRMLEFGQGLKERGLLIASESLKSHADAARVRVRGGRPQVVDGPFAEAKEMVGGFFLLELPEQGRGPRHRRAMPGRRMGHRRGARAGTVLRGRGLGTERFSVPAPASSGAAAPRWRRPAAVPAPARGARRCAGGPRRARPGSAARGPRSTASASGVSGDRPMAPKTCIARSTTRVCSCAATTLIAATSCAAAALPGAVQRPRGAQHQQPRLVDLQARLRDPVLHVGEVADVLAEGAPLQRALAHQLERQLALADACAWQWCTRPGPSRACAIAKPSPASPSRLSAGTRTSRSTISQWPSGDWWCITGMLRTIATPGVSIGTSTMLWPRCASPSAASSQRPITIASGTADARRR